MKQVLLSADGEISVFSVPDEVADHLDRYCRDFCDGWLRKSPDARKYYRKENGWSGLVYDETDFIDYLNQYVFREKSSLIQTLHGVYGEKDLPAEYADLPYFNF